MEVDHVICKSIYDPVVNGDPLKCAQGRGIIEVATRVPVSVASLLLQGFRKWHVTGWLVSIRIQHEFLF